jgi:mono/diheme cytochrome c family protein
MRRWIAQTVLVSTFGLASASLAEVQADGQEEFQHHCALCHGLDGRGAGRHFLSDHPECCKSQRLA